ncbi:phosphopyruvate hydratase [Patescibacteria group bacterium]
MAKVTIRSIDAMEILDSRGYPTVQTKVTLSNKVDAKASVPSGASTGSRAALELRDGDKRYDGKGVLQAVSNVNTTINEALKGQSVDDTRKLDRQLIELDGTENKTNLGANALLSVSLALARVASENEKIPLYKYLRQTYAPKYKLWNLPKPMFNILNGGVHADSGLSIQEFMIVPDSNTFQENLDRGAEVFHRLAGLLSNEGYSVAVGDEGGFAPRLKNHTEAFEFIIAAMTKADYVPGDDIKIALDAAASQFFSGQGRYALRPEGQTYTTEQLIQLYNDWRLKYPLISVEDGLTENDWEGWRVMTGRLGDKMMLVGDDLFVTQTKWLQKGISKKAANAVIIKPNQVGTISEAIECLRLAKENDFKVIVSHRSGETNDAFISDLAVAIGADYLKAGSLAREERLAKYNRLLEIEKEISPHAQT